MYRKYNKEHFHLWLDKTLRKHIPKESVGLCFNLSEVQDTAKGKVYSIHLIASEVFDEEDWACHEIYDTRKHRLNFTIDNDWKTALRTMVTDLGEYIPTSKKLCSYEGVGIGFVDGDILIVYRKNADPIDCTPLLQDYFEKW